MGYLFVRQEVEQHIGHLHPVVELDVVLLQIGYQGKDERFVLVILGKLQCRQVGQAADVVEEPLQIELHLQRRVPFFKGKHSLPVKPEVGLIKLFIQHIVNGLVVELLVRREEQPHQLQRSFVAEIKAVFSVRTLALAQCSPVFVGIVFVQPVKLVQNTCVFYLQRGDRAV